MRVEMLDGNFCMRSRCIPSQRMDSIFAQRTSAARTISPLSRWEDACPVDAAPKMGLRVEGTTPPARGDRECKRIMRAAHIDVGGVEYSRRHRDGQVYYYDINALSNFVTDAPTVVALIPSHGWPTISNGPRQSARALSFAGSSRNGPGSHTTFVG